MPPDAAWLAVLATLLSLTPSAVPALLETDFTEMSSFPRLQSGLYFVDRQNYAQIASALASTRKEIFLTTLSFRHEGADHSADQLDLMKNFAYYLHDISRLQNTFIVSYDEATCKALHSAGILCFMDEAAPHPETLPGKYCLDCSKRIVYTVSTWPHFICFCACRAVCRGATSLVPTFTCSPALHMHANVHMQLESATFARA